MGKTRHVGHLLSNSHATSSVSSFEFDCLVRCLVVVTVEHKKKKDPFAWVEEENQ